MFWCSIATQNNSALTHFIVVDNRYKTYRSIFSSVCIQTKTCPYFMQRFATNTELSIDLCERERERKRACDVSNQIGTGAIYCWNIAGWAGLLTAKQSLRRCFIYRLSRCTYTAQITLG